MSLGAKLYIVGENDRRRSDRRRTGARSTLRGGATSPLDIIVHDISLGGFSCEAEEPLEPGAEVVLGLDGRGSAAAVVRWREGQMMGCEFVRPLTQRDLHGAFRGGVVVGDRFPAPPERD